MSSAVAPAPIDRRRSGAARAQLAQWLRHHVASLVATAVDYGVMVACVELARVPPVGATAAGAFMGALVNLELGRRYTYRVTGGLRSYAWRYALVSAASLGWNAGGEALLHNVLGLQYVVARVITSLVVSNAWNYPLQKFFVFATPRSAAARQRP